ncbi:Alg9-like mannosyltransferase family-domain-containing protein [Schizothecium vesticola]|uniref:Mannosyltransferase n=1 Tax=Schizothecium vesticola TaxID=314040 RepID=A0AA40F8A3_9PEZI|nr:Alg9-like mannosyltransferase family-domain-containing protein [Schizothecium vesticola]
MVDKGGPKPQKITETRPPSTPSIKPRPPPPRKLHPEVIAAQIKDILSALLVFRFINALCVRTFFQPDEYFQALEPAWSMAFDSESGAWLTWEWQHQLRSSLHPAIFGAAYKAVYTLMAWLEFYEPFRAFILVPLPKIIQSVFAALGDFYTWRLATEIYGIDSNVPWAALWMTVLNPWQWYCSTRTFSNSLETTLTIAALYYWPWELLKDAKADKTVALQSRRGVNSLRISLVLAAFAVILRPTNILVWLGILTITLTRFTLDGASPLQTSTLLTLAREVILCGGGALAVSALSDRLYFGFWAFPPYKWLYFNISQSLAVFYGRMPWHYYLVQGIPLLTTTFLPFVLIGLYKTTLSFSSSPFSPSALSTLQSNTLRTLAFTLLTMVAALSCITHKEVRFLYPLLPVLHLLGAPYLVQFFTLPPTTPPATTTKTTTTLRHKLFLANLLSLNFLLALYLSLLHQPAPLSVLAFLRTDFERLHPDRLSFSAPNATSPLDTDNNELFALFLTPCHSTPWRSHLVYPALRARALTCEPPLATAPGSVERETYMDEADRFYARDGEEYGRRFLAEEMWPVGGGGGEVPRYIVGFEGIEGVLEGFFGEAGGGSGMGGRLTRRWEGFNGLFNEDWRRRGRLVVWDTGVWSAKEE